MEPARNPINAEHDVHDVHDVQDVHDALERAAELLRAHDELLALDADDSEDTPRSPVERARDTQKRQEKLEELRALLDPLHPADIAYLLEALPLRQRLVVWDLVRTDREGEILLEVSDAVRETLIENMDDQELVAATGQLDTDEIAYLAPDLPPEVIADVFKLLPPEEREQLRAAMSYAEDTAGALMDFDMVQIREDVTLEVVLRYLRRLDELPDHTDQLFVVDREGQLKGLVPVNRLLVTDIDAVVGDMMLKDYTRFNAQDEADEVAAAFERYDLVSAPVVDDSGKLVGRMSVNAVVDYVREKSDSEKLSAGGLREDEDIFASVWKSVQNRWTWLALNLITAFIASRVIGSVRRLDRQTGGVGGADADYCGYRRQLRQPNHHHDRAGAGTGPNHASKREQVVQQRAGGQRVERPDLGRGGGPVCVFDLSQLATGPGDDAGDGAESVAGGVHGRIDPHGHG